MIFDHSLPEIIKIEHTKDKKKINPFKISLSHRQNMWAFLSKLVFSGPSLTLQSVVKNKHSTTYDLDNKGTTIKYKHFLRRADFVELPIPSIPSCLVPYQSFTCPLPVPYLSLTCPLPVP